MSLKLLSWQEAGGAPSRPGSGLSVAHSHSALKISSTAPRSSCSVSNRLK